jgi:biotin synthase-like enzyme
LQKRIFDIAVSSLVIVLFCHGSIHYYNNKKKAKQRTSIVQAIKNRKRMNRSGVTNLEVCTSTMLMKVNKQEKG